MFDQKTLLKNFSIGFLPLLVFIIAEEFFGLMIGLLTAVAFGMAETAYVFFHERRVDRFILFDTGLIVLLGLLSLLLENDIFFKLKPALVELILVILLGFSGFSSSQILLKMSGRYMKGVKLSGAQIEQMRLMMRRLFFLFMVHTLLIFYAAFFMSTRAWGFISGGLFYIIMGAAMAVEFLRAVLLRKKMNRRLRKEEWFDLVTRQGKIIGKAPRSEVHGNPDLLHPVVHVHIIDSQGWLFLQKRSQQKDLYPGYWDTAIGGHVSSGESIEQALRREAEEELGVSMGNFKPLFRYVMKNEYESELVHGFLLKDDGPFYLNKEEIAEGRFWKIKEIEEKLGKGIFTPNFEQEFDLLRKYVFNPRSKTPSRRRKHQP